MLAGANVYAIAINQSGIDAEKQVQLVVRFGLYDADDKWIRQSREAVSVMLADIPDPIKATLNTLQKQLLEWQQAEGTDVMKAELGTEAPAA